MNSRLLAAAPLIVAVALLSACGNSDSSESGDSVPENTASAPAVAGGAAGFLETLKNSDIHFSSDAVAIETGKQVCVEMKAGKPLLNVAGEMKGVADAGQAAIVAGAAVQAFCPDLVGKIGS